MACYAGKLHTVCGDKLKLFKTSEELNINRLECESDDFKAQAKCLEKCLSEYRVEMMAKMDAELRSTSTSAEVRSF